MGHRKMEEDDEEDFVLYGTPFPIIAGEVALFCKKVPIHEQAVNDERGRPQRFHGAFEGGFSAGYFNTVDTKEGWAPLSFTSSKTKRQTVEQHVADFMDDADFSEHGIAPRKINTTSD